MIFAGQLNQRVELQSPVRALAPGTNGEVVLTWETLATVWASVRGTGGREGVQADQVRADLDHLVEIRFRDNVISEQRLLYRSRVLSIEAVIDPDGRRERLHLHCREVA